VKKRIKALLEGLNFGLFGKDDAVRLVFLAAAAGESVFMLGLPGIAKSLIARRLKFAFSGARVFEYLMNRFSTSDEVFGAVSISELKNNDRYERNIEGFLPDCEIVFLDEIWKAGPAIQNALLTVINEKIFRNGDREIRIPLKALISASNAVPEAGEGLEALWDRFLVRVKVEPIKDDGDFLAMLDGPETALADNIPAELKITNAEYEDWQAGINRVRLGRTAKKIILYIRNVLIPEYNAKEENAQKQFYISDRRWKKIARLLRCAAFLNGRQAVNPADCFLVRHCLWSSEAETGTADGFARRAISANILKEAPDFENLRAELLEFQNEIREATVVTDDTRREEVRIVQDEYLYIEAIKSYIRKPDWDALDAVPRDTKIYRKQAHSQGYISYIPKGGANTMSAGGRQVSLEYSFVFDRAAPCSRGPALFTINIDGAVHNLETERKGELKRYKIRPPAGKTVLWEKKLAARSEYINSLKTALETFKSQKYPRLKGNLFVPAADINSLLEYAEELGNSLAELEIQILDTAHRAAARPENSPPPGE